MISVQSPINGLIAELEECLGRIDASGQALAGAYLSSAIDSLKASTLAGKSTPSAPIDRRKLSPATFH